MSTRTTLKLDKKVYKEAKKRAVDEEVNLQDLVNKVLAEFLGFRKEGKLSFDGFDVGGVKTKLDRKTIYEDV